MPFPASELNRAGMNVEEMKMRLRNEGPIRPAPKLEGNAGKVQARLDGLDRMQSFTHWAFGDSSTVDGAEFHADGRELGHIHPDGSSHILLTRELRKLLIDCRLAKSFLGLAEWVEVPTRTAAEADHAFWIFQLGYDRLQGTSGEELVARIHDAAN